LRNRLKEMARHYHVEEVYAFGSRAKEVAARVRNEETGVAHPESDLDIGVRIKAGATLGP
jgi:predicted nucleotidyltransferase